MKISEWPKWLRNNILYNKKVFAEDSDDPESWDEIEEVSRTENLEEATVVSSQWYAGSKINLHKLFLDLDCEHVYVPSSTPAHGHLMINVDLTYDDLYDLVKMLVKLDILGPGSLAQLRQREANTLRLPWVKKDVERPIPAPNKDFLELMRQSGQNKLHGL